MERNIVWSHSYQPGMEHLRLSQQNGEIVANGLIIAVVENVPIRAWYSIHCDDRWHVQEVRIELLDSNTDALWLKADGEGRWTTASGDPLPSLDGCIDVDISVTPFTNTLPIRRLTFAPGTSQELLVAYIKMPEMTVEPQRQRYTCLDASVQGSVYRYEGLSSGYTNEITADSDGLIISYPGVFERIWAD